MKTLHLPALLALACCSIPGAFAQTPPQTSPPQLPSDPAALMQLAWQQNGLHEPGLQPWHARATWQILDKKGKAEKQGTWEEWWAGPHESKMVYNSPDFQQTYWATTQGGYTLEGHGSISWVEDFVMRTILSPVATARDLSRAQLKVSHIKVDGAPLDCAVVADSKTNPVGDFCFDPGRTALRASASLIGQTTMNSIVQFQGRHLAKDIYVSRVGMPAIQIHLDEIEALAPGAESQLAPPPEAKLVTPRTARITLSSGVAAGHRLSGDVPEYPLLAKQQHVQGTVVLWAVIGKDGAIHDLEIIAGPPELQESAVDAVKTWRYSPYLLNGEPVEVHTQIDVVYRLER